MTALVVTHCEAEGPGLLETWLPAEGLPLRVVRPWAGEEVPSSLDGYRALVVLGGPQQAYDDTSAPWLPGVKALLAQAVSAGLPTLGICLGAQLLAVACGGTVAVGAEGPELGARVVGKRDVAGTDPLMWDLPLSPMVVQWHWDAVTALPPGATLLLSSPRYEHQAFRLGERAWGLQFHVETDAALLMAWAGELEAGDALQEQMLAHLDEVAEVWGEVMRRFARLAA